MHCRRAAIYTVILAIALSFYPCDSSHARQGRLGQHGGASYYTKIKLSNRRSVRLFVSEAGHGQTILMLHGFAASGYTWRKLTPTLARHYRIIALDLKGFGRSAKPADNYYSVAEQARLVTAFIRMRKLRNIILVGHSLGGAIALKVVLNLNRREATRVSRIVLMSTPAYPQRLSASLAFLRNKQLARTVLGLLPADLVASMTFHSNKMGFEHISLRDIQYYGARMRENGAIHALIKTAQQIIPKNFSSLTRRYHLIRQPALLIWCQNDPTVPVRTGVRLKHALAQARLRVIRRCEHSPQEETPHTTLRLIDQFLRRR